MDSIEITTPESVGLSKSKLAEIPKLINSKYIKTHKMGGCLVAVCRKGKLAHVSLCGKANIKENIDIKTDTIFRIYSMTKPITSTMIMILFDQGKISLNDPVSKYVPQLKNLSVYSSGSYPTWTTKPPIREVTIHDLLTHQSGMSYGFLAEYENPSEVSKAMNEIRFSQLFTGKNRHIKNLSDFLDIIKTLPLESSPGSHWNYSVSFEILGHIAEVISGKPLNEAFKENIFTPLGMTDTDFEVPDHKLERFASNYEVNINGELTLFDDPYNSEFRTPVTFYSGGAGLVSTMSDYLKFCQIFINKGLYRNQRILSENSIYLMTSNQLPDNKSIKDHQRAPLFSSMNSGTRFVTDGLSFGLGFAIVSDIQKNGGFGSKGTFHWIGAASTYFWVDPQKDLVTLILSQVYMSRPPIMEEIKKIVYSSLTD
jgi:CubicO group peptidase (beta-lactamase class C family)